MQIMSQTAEEMGLKRFFLSVPFFTPTLSRLWVSLITNSPKDLVYPLIESLEHPMLARHSHLYSGGPASSRTYRDLIKNTFFKSKSGSAFFRFRAHRKTVRSVQRLQLPAGNNAKWINDQYLQWIPQFLTPLVVVKQQGTKTIFSLFGSRINLLEMQLSKERSTPDRQLLYVTRGVLVSKENRGRLEFRVVLNRRYAIAAIHDFRPALPWFIYKYTQAKLHLWVMNAFASHLALISNAKHPGEDD
jgi:hypothetical protein